MSTPLLATKLYIPPLRPALVPRPRLVERLDEGVCSGQRLTLISAPAGFGKTTLLSEWLAESTRRGKRGQTGAGIPVAWLSLDAEDNDPARFFTYLLAALQQIDPRIGVVVDLMLQTPQPPPPESLLTDLINDLAALPQSCILVLDDYHLIQSLPIHQQLAFLLEHLPPQVHLVLATREDPPLPLARLRARAQVVEFRQADLAFTEMETVEFLQRVMGLDLSPGDMATLGRRTEGWIAGLQLAALSMQRSERAGQSVADFSGSHRYVLDYLVEEVFQQQRPDVQEFLLETSILDRLTASLCDAVTGRKDAQQLLEGLDQANLFIVRLDDSRQWYRYHRLFRDLLHTRRTALNLVPLHRRAAIWYEHNGFLDEAMKHVLVAEDWDEAERLLWPAAGQAINNGHFATAGRWFDAMPEARLRKSPRLATLKGWVLLPAGQFETAETWAALAEDLLPADAPPLSRALVACLQLNLAHVKLDIPRVIDLAHHALELLADEDPYGLRGTALGNLASAQRILGDIPAATQTYREMARLGQEGGHPISVIGAWSSLAWLLHLQLEPREAVALCHRALEEAMGPSGKPLPLAGQPHLVLGMVAYDRNELTAAQEHLVQAVELARQFGPSTGTVHGAFLLAWIQELAGDRDAALATASRTRQGASQFNLPLIESFLAACEADFSLRLGNIEDAARWAEAAKLSPTDTVPYEREGEYVTCARLLLAQGRLAEAQQLLTSLEQFARARGNGRSLLTALILRAQAEGALGHTSEALAHLDEAVHLAARPGYLRAFLDEGPPIRALLISVRQSDPLFVDCVLDAFASEGQDMAGKERLPPSPVVPSSALVEPLSERELEVLELVALGLSNREIADRLFITVGTVKTHVHNIYGKLGVRSRTQAAVQARERGLL